MNSLGPGMMSGQPGAAMAAAMNQGAAAAQSWQSLAANSGYPMSAMMPHNPSGYQPNGQAPTMNPSYPSYPTAYNSANTAAAMASMSAAANPYMAYGAAAGGAYNYYGLNGVQHSQPSPTGVPASSSPPISTHGSSSAEPRPPSIGSSTLSSAHLSGAGASSAISSSSLSGSTSSASSVPTSSSPTYGGSSLGHPSYAGSSLASSLSQFSGQSSLPHHLPSVSHHNSIPSWSTPHYGAAAAASAAVGENRTAPSSAGPPSIYDYGAELSKTSVALYGQSSHELFGMVPNSANPTLGSSSHHLPL